MLYIKKADFAKLKKQYSGYISKAILPHEWNGKKCNVGDWTAIEGCLTGDFSNGCTLIFEHIHFEII